MYFPAYRFESHSARIAECAEKIELRAENCRLIAARIRDVATSRELLDLAESLEEQAMRLRSVIGP